jgi:hypothetical protein
MSAQRRTGWPIALALLLGACSMIGPSLPGGYTIIYADRGKAWLANPDGTIAHGALIQQLYKDDRRILLITYATTYASDDGIGFRVEGPRPLDGNCYVALLIEGGTGETRQVRLAEADRLAAKMDLVASSSRGCVRGMPTS